LAGELYELLGDIEACALDPCSGAKLVVAFFETDVGVLGHCDDSIGLVGDVYRFAARELFLQYAIECDEKKWLADLVLESNREDDYGVRDTLIDCAKSYLPEPEIRSMITRLQEWADEEVDKHARRRWLYRVESLAQQIGDAPLFEKTRKLSWGGTPTAACIDIAQVYYETGDPNTALSWLMRIPVGEEFQADERDELYLRIYGQLGDQERQAEVAWRIFRRMRSRERLDQLISIVGESQRDAIVSDEVVEILAQPTLSYSDAAFLLQIERFDDAETYLLDHADELNGDYYDRLLPMAEVLEATGRPIGATVLYRALLDSILRRAISKIYHHAVRYLKKLDLLATQVSDWGRIDNHSVYFEQLETNHGRKKSFWSRYERVR